MNTIRSWMSHHPFKVVLFTFLFTLIPAIMAVTNDDIFYYGLGAYLILVIVWAYGVWRYSKSIISVLLIMGIMAAPLKQAKGAMIGVGVIVICVGGICLYKVVKVCQKKFPPKDTNAPPTEFTAVGGEYGGAMEYSSIGSCWDFPPQNNLTIPGDVPPEHPTTFTLSVLVDGVSVITSMTAEDSQETAQDWNQFQAEMAEHGLHLTGHSSNLAQYERNGVPCSSSEVPLEFDPLTGRVINNTSGNLRRITVERSRDLVAWFPLMTTDVSYMSRFKVVDTTREGQMFYRVSVGHITQP